jgi:hypothetical protein
VVAMNILLDEIVEVGYGQLYVTDPEMEPPVPELTFAGQQNGLCGAATAGLLFLVTGLRHGSVGLTVGHSPAKPAVADEWEEVVEASFTSAAEGLVMWGPDSESYSFALPAGHYGVRYCARGMQAGWDAESNYDSSAPLDRYLLLFWPEIEGAPTPERIVRQSSEVAAYWHQAHAGWEGAARSANTEPADDSQGSTDEMLAEVRLNLDAVHGLDATLAVALARSSDSLQRSVARWAALRALSIAGRQDHPRLRPVVALLERGERVSPPFDSQPDAVAALEISLSNTPVRPVRGRDMDDDDQWPVREYAVLGSVSATASPNALEAALGAITQAAVAYGADDVDTFRALLYEAFPGLRA